MKQRSLKRILVTGGAGFLGSHLCEKLLSSKNFVICLDNFFTGKEENISNLLKNENFKVLNHDICEEIFIEVDEIYNLACPASPSHYQIDPIYTMKTSFMGALNILELARKLKVKKIFQASTSEVYGDPKEHPQNENYFGNVNPIGIRSCYDVGKRSAETLFFDYFRRYNIPIKVGRIFNTYGPKMQVNDGRVVSNFIVQALKNENLTVYGDGLQTRSFCYVDDLIDGFIKFMKTEEGVVGPINLGNPKEYTVLELAKLIIELTGSSSKIVFKELPFDDPKRRKPDIGKAKKLIGWEPLIGLKEGLLETIKYFDGRIFCSQKN